MSPAVNLLPCAIAELFAQATITGKITRADQYGLMAALLDDTIGKEEKSSIDRLLYAACRGRIKVVNEISAVS